MKRFWVSWYSTYNVADGCTEPPFQFWESGIAWREREGEETEVGSYCAVVDADSEEQIWRAIAKHFPDYEQRFCEEASNDWAPNDRFPNFENRTLVS